MVLNVAGSSPVFHPTKTLVSQSLMRVFCFQEIGILESKSWFSSYLVWVGVKFSNAKEEELLINDASQIGSKKFDFSIE